MILNNVFKLIAIIFNALLNLNKSLIIKESDFKTLIKTLFLNNVFINLRFKRILNIYLQSYKFIFLFISSLTNLIT